MMNGPTECGNCNSNCAGKILSAELIHFLNLDVESGCFRHLELIVLPGAAPFTTLWQVKTGITTVLPVL